MAINNFPYTDLNSLNLDWVIKRISELEESSGAAEIAELKAAVEAVQAELEAAQDAVTRETMYKELLALKRKTAPLTGSVKTVTADLANYEAMYGLRISGVRTDDITFRINGAAVNFNMSIGEPTLSTGAGRIRTLHGYTINQNTFTKFQASQRPIDTSVYNVKMYIDGQIAFDTANGQHINEVITPQICSQIDIVLHANTDTWIMYHINASGVHVMRNYHPVSATILSADSNWSNIFSNDMMQAILSVNNGEIVYLHNSQDMDGAYSDTTIPF